MAAVTDTFDLGGLRLLPGEARRLDLVVPLEPFELGEDRYAVEPNPVAVRVDMSRMASGGFSLRVRFEARLVGPCMRCLEPADPLVEVDAREVDQGEGVERVDELDSPYVKADVLDIRQWANDAFALAMPALIVCQDDCRGLCADCGANLNDDPEHAHEREPDPRWAALRELKLE